MLRVAPLLHSSVVMSFLTRRCRGISVLHVSVFAAAQSRVTLVTLRGGGELRFGERLSRRVVARSL